MFVWCIFIDKFVNTYSVMKKNINFSCYLRVYEAIIQLYDCTGNANNKRKKSLEKGKEKCFTIK